jgi:hypothetical protein
MADTFPTVTVEMAFGDDWQTVTPTWTDITSDVLESGGITIGRGRATEFDTFVAGTCSLTLNNSDRDYDPFHSTGPHFGDLEPGVPIRVQATFDPGAGSVTYDLFRGFVQSWPQSYRQGNTFAATDITAGDGFTILARGELAPGTTYSQEMSGVRVGNVLDDIGWPAADRDLDDGNTILQATTANDPDGEETGNVLTYLQRVERSEDGFLFMMGDGRIRFWERHARFTETAMTASQATWSDDGSDNAYANVEFERSDTFVSNDVRRQRVGGVLQRKTDATSDGQHGPRVDSQTDLLMISDGEAETFAARFLAAHKGAQTRVTRLVVKPRRDPTQLFPVVLAAELLDRVTVQRTPQGVGSQISVEQIVQRVTHQIGVKSWTTTLGVSPTDINDSTVQMVFDSATQGKFDTNTFA